MAASLRAGLAFASLITASCTYQRSVTVWSPEGISCADTCAQRYPGPESNRVACMAACPGAAAADSGCFPADTGTPSAELGRCVQKTEVSGAKTLLLLGLIVLSVGSLAFGVWAAGQR